MVIQTISSEQAVTASHLTGPRNENIQRRSSKVDFSAMAGSSGGSAGGLGWTRKTGGNAGGHSPSGPAGFSAIAPVFGAAVLVAGDGVLDTCSLSWKGPNAIHIPMKVNPSIGGKSRGRK